MPSGSEVAPASFEAQLGPLVARLRAVAGDELAAHALDRLLRPRLRAYFRAAGSASESDDLVQETLGRVFSGMTELRSAERFLPWLFVIARNVRLSAGGRRGRDPLAAAVAIDDGDTGPLPSAPGPDPEVEAIAGEATARLERAIAELPPRQRQCLLLRVREGLSYGEIAELLGTSVLTVRNHLALARLELRRRCGDLL